MARTIAVARLLLGPEHEHASAAEPDAGAYPLYLTAGHQRLGRRLAGHARPHQPRGALAARSWRCEQATAVGRPRAARASGALPGVRPRRPSFPRRSAPAWPPDRRQRISPRLSRRARSCSRRDARRPLIASLHRATARRALAALPAALARILDRRARRRRADRRRGRALSRRAGVDLHALALVADELRRRAGRRRGDLRRQPQHQLHQRLRQALRLLRLLRAATATRRATSCRLEELVRRAREEAWDMGATEVCMQAGLPPSMTAVSTSTSAAPIKASRAGHARPRLLARGGAATAPPRSRMPIREYLGRAAGRRAGQRCPARRPRSWTTSLRRRISPGRITAAKWREVITTAHALGIPTTSHDHVRPRRDGPPARRPPRPSCATSSARPAASPSSCRSAFVHSEAPMYAQELPCRTSGRAQRRRGGRACTPSRD